MTDDGARQLSAWLAVGATALAAVLPVLAALTAARDGLRCEGLLRALAPLPRGTEASAGEVWLCLGLAALPVAAAVWALLSARRLFLLYAGGHALTAGAAGAVASIGRALVAMAVLDLLVPALQTLIVTMDNPAGSRQLSVALDSGAMGLLLAGGLMAVMGAAMRQAAAQRAELEGFV